MGLGFAFRSRRERRTPISLEVKRRGEIKAGIITAAVGLSLMVLLFVLMNGIVATGRVSDAAAEILMRLWIIGVVPLFVGGALIFNGMFVSKHGTGSSVDTETGTRELSSAGNARQLSALDTNELESQVPFSVTDRTTRHLSKVKRKDDPE